MSEVKEIKVRCSSDKYMTFSEMIPFEDNPRELTDSGFKKLKKSLLELGVFKPFLVWKQGNRIIGGNQRYTVIHKLAEAGYQVPPLPVNVLDVDEGTARLIVLRDNQSDGDWAYEQLAEYLQDLERFGVDKSLSGFGDREFDDLKKLIQSPDQLRESLEKMSEGEDVEEMMKKKFGISFKVPDADWAYWKSVMKKLKEETGSDEVWPNIKYLMSKTFSTEEFGGMEPASEEEDEKLPPKIAVNDLGSADHIESEDDDDDNLSDLDLDDEPAPPPKKAATKLRKAKPVVEDDAPPLEM